MPRTVFVTGSLPDGGAERHAISLLKSLAARGHECHAVAIKPTAATPASLALPPLSTLTCLEAQRYLDSRTVKRFAGLLEALKPQVIIAANPYALLHASLARLAARSQARLVVTYHSARPVNRKEWLQMLVYRPLFWNADCAVFLCRNQQRYWQRRGLLARHNVVIHNGIDTAHFRERRRALAPSDHEFVIGLPALLRPEKNHQQLVQAVAALRKLGVPARALMIGDGAQRAAVEALARQLGVDQHVTITGMLADVRPCIAACDVITLCSTTETFSLAALEAMAMGRPVVLTDVGGASEMVVPGWNGLLYPVGDTESYVNCLLRLSDRASARRMGRRAREMTELRFSAGHMTDQYESLLEELCRKDHASAMTAASSP